MKSIFLNIIIAGSIIVLIIISVKEYFIDKTKKPFQTTTNENLTTPTVTSIPEKLVDCNNPFFPLKKGDKKQYTLKTSYKNENKTETLTVLVSTEIIEASGSSIVIKATAPTIDWEKTTNMKCTTEGIYGHPLPYLAIKNEEQELFVLTLPDNNLLLPNENRIYIDKNWKSSISLSQLTNLIPIPLPISIPLSITVQNKVEQISSNSANINDNQTLTFSSNFSFEDSELSVIGNLISPNLEYTFDTKKGINNIKLHADFMTVGRIDSEITLIN